MKYLILAISLMVLVVGCAPQEVPPPPPAKEAEPAPAPAPEPAAVVPSVTVSDQEVISGKVTIDSAVAEGPSWMVIHIEKDGKPGPVIGHAAVAQGESSNIEVEIDVASATPTLFAMLHVDEGEIGVYEFPGADAPETDEAGIVVKPFKATIPGMEDTTEDALEAAPAEDAEPAVNEISVTARRFEFEPSTITVSKGDNVKLLITSVDVTHGINIPAFGVNAQLNAGQTTEVEFIADQEGTFPFACSVVCGSGHTGMTGTLIVQ